MLGNTGTCGPVSKEQVTHKGYRFGHCRLLFFQVSEFKLNLTGAEEAFGTVATEEKLANSEALVEEEEIKKSGLSFAGMLGTPLYYFHILYTHNAGIALLVFLVFYTIGMSYKLYRIYHGTYTQEEPVFLKYKQRQLGTISFTAGSEEKVDKLLTIMLLFKKYKYKMNIDLKSFNQLN